MKTISNRTDIEKLVHSFYAKIRKNELLGPIFNARITEEDWPEHLSKLSDFWERNLLNTSSFHGNPTAKHIEVDTSMDYSIEQRHFAQWLQLWFETIDEHFTGELADKAKRAARKMSTGQYLAIWSNRPTNN